MKRSGTDDHQTVFRTDPPLTKEVLEFAVKHYLGQSYGQTLTVKNGLLVVSRVGFTRQDIAMLEERLTEAENFLQDQKANAEKSRENDLQARAARSGVSLED